MPSCSPFSSMTRISRARMRSLMRIKDFAERLSSAMVLLQPRSAALLRCQSGTALSLRTHPEYSIGLVAESRVSAGLIGRTRGRQSPGTMHSHRSQIAFRSYASDLDPNAFIRFKFPIDLNR